MFSLSQIYWFAVYGLDRDSLKQKVEVEESTILEDIYYEWNKLLELAEVGEEDLMILVYDMVTKYLQKI